MKAPAPCPKCDKPMERRYRSKKQQRKKTAYGFSQWDYCAGCHHVQHYECFKVGVQTVAAKKKPKKTRIPRMTYQQYMGSAYWIKRRNKYYADHGKVCAVCGKTEGIALHHKIYKLKEFGREPDHDLVALCHYHHGLFHQECGVKKNMRKTTNAYVTTMKQLHNSQIDDLSWIK